VPSALVVGAGIFGTALADRLARDGWEVTLVDEEEPGSPRAESGGETRLLRFSHGPDSHYARSAARARELWLELGEKVLLESGVVWFARRPDGWEVESERTLAAAGIPVERLEPGDVAHLFPGARVDDLAFGLLEPSAGILRAGEGVRALARRARSAGARIERGRAMPDGRRVVLEEAPGGGSERILEADHVVWSCGAWLARLFPALVTLRVTRQDVVLFHAPAPWSTPGVPGWVDFDSSFYGHGVVEPHGFKVSCDLEGAELDLGDRPAAAARESIERSRAYLAERFPPLADAPVRSAPVCHYSLTSDGNFLLDRHPLHQGVWLLGGGSGHGYKHGPAVAEHAAAVLAGAAKPEERYALGERAHSRALRTAGS
jgi:glycine/D-amino acid oxidase-like deaminating enzyme